MKKYVKVISITLSLALILAFLFWWGGNSPSLHGVTVVTEQIEIPAETETKVVEKAVEESVVAPVPTEEAETPAPESAQLKTEAVKEDKPKPALKEEASFQPEKKEDTCFISIRCDTILKNQEYVRDEIAEIIPQSGVILENCEVVLSEGESVFDVLLRETKSRGIHLEFVKTPGYNSAYIEGIANIYEFDCGELSGWMYKVNGSFPEVGCSEHILKNGDKIEWVYTCDSGKDVGSSRPIR